MWFLKYSNGKVKYLIPNKIINVGRKQTDIILENDSSISRAHASITVQLKDEMMTSEVASLCTVKDSNSKYGTFIIRNKIQMRVPSEGLELQPLDTLKFGLQQHIFTVEYIHFVTVTSRISTEHRKKVKEIMDNIGGIVTDRYNDNCTHLTATIATSTNKIISALIKGLPIVDINFWIAVLNAVEKDNVLPDPNSFILQIQDKGVNAQRVSLKPNPKRRILFQDKIFIFFSQNLYNDYKKLIRDAGGKAELHTINLKNISSELFAENNIIMQITNDSPTDDFAVFNIMLYEKMQQMKLRMISETEIPLAVIYTSLEQYCNPKYHFKELLKRKGVKKDTSEVLVIDTEDMLKSSIKKNPISITSGTNFECIPETEEILNDENNSFEKQKRSIEDSDVIDVELQLENSSGKCSFSPEVKKAKLEKNVTNKNTKVLNNSINTKETVSNSSLKCSVSKQDFIEPKELNHLENDNNKQTEIIDFFKIDNKESNIWKTKKKETPVIENPKGRSWTCDNFEDFEEQKKDIKKINQLDKWGFKKSERKPIDFDLDDFDMDEPVKSKKKAINFDIEEEMKYKKKASDFDLDDIDDIEAEVISKNRFNNAVNNKEELSKNTKALGLRERNKINKNIELKSFSGNKFDYSKENVKVIHEENTAVINKMNSSTSFLRKTVIGKTFKKVPVKIPTKRLTLENFKVTN